MSTHPSPTDAAAFHWTIRVYWEDTDAGGIVFYANYLKYFERARTEWLRSLGVNQQTLRERRAGMFVVSETTVRYLSPARLDDRIDVATSIAGLGKASVVLRQIATRLSPDGGGDEAPLLLCEGTIRIGWVDCDTLKPARIPQDILEVLR